MDTKSYRMLPNQTMSEIQLESTEYASNTCPLPSNLKEYLPFACGQLGINCSVIIQVERDVIISNKIERQRQRSQTVTQSNPNQHINISALQEVSADVIEEEIDRGVTITAIYDIQDKLTQLQIGGPFKKPRKLYQILSHIIAFFPYLSSLKVLPPIDKYSAYEIGKMLTISNISDITLDGCFVSEANFYTLLEGNVTLKRLSLARCSITDCVLQEITQRLEHPTEASKFLSILILSSNNITDEGAQHISKMLRSNINLCYLNLADNSITDAGATSILNALMEFEISEDELQGYRARYTEYLLQKLNRVETLPEVKPVENEQKPKMKTKKRQLSKTPSILTTKNNSSVKDIQKVEFSDPFHNFYFVDGKICCKGNHYLQCLNLEYNDLSYKILEKIVQVLNYQKYLNEKPRGILNIRLEGNLLPRFCAEYEQIDELIIEAVDSQIVTPVEQRKKKSK